MSTSWDALFQQIAGQANADAAEVLEGANLIAEITATLGAGITPPSHGHRRITGKGDAAEAAPTPKLRPTANNLPHVVPAQRESD